MRAPSWVKRKRRWQGERPATSSEAQARILDVVEGLVALGASVTCIPMVDIAEAADVARPELYKHFRTKDALVAAFHARQQTRGAA